MIIIFKLMSIRRGIVMEFSESTCDCCGKVYMAGARRHYCSHCDKFYYVCKSCVDNQPKCRLCNVPLMRKREPLAQQKPRVAVH